MGNVLGKIKLDKEWEELILDALEIGISVEEIKNFFKEHSRPK
jgi:DNA-binding transcriptional regulator YhcF (GntR family)